MFKLSHESRLKRSCSEQMCVCTFADRFTYDLNYFTMNEKEYLALKLTSKGYWSTGCEIFCMESSHPNIVQWAYEGVSKGSEENIKKNPIYIPNDLSFDVSYLKEQLQKKADIKHTHVIADITDFKDHTHKSSDIQSDNKTVISQNDPPTMYAILCKKENGSRFKGIVFVASDYMYLDVMYFDQEGAASVLVGRFSSNKSDISSCPFVYITIDDVEYIAITLPHILRFNFGILTMEASDPDIVRLTTEGTISEASVRLALNRAAGF